MSLELYNTTNKVKIVPKYRYNGKHVLQPFGSVDIEDYTAEFFAPYTRIGVVVRAKSNGIVEEKKEELVDEIKKEEKEDSVEPKKEGITEDKVEIQPQIPEDEIKEDKVEEIKEETIEDAVKENSVEDTLSREDLQSMTMKDLRELAEKKGIDVSEIKRKDPLVDAILAGNK